MCICVIVCMRIKYKYTYVKVTACTSHCRRLCRARAAIVKHYANGGDEFIHTYIYMYTCDCACVCACIAMHCTTAVASRILVSHGCTIAFERRRSVAAITRALLLFGLAYEIPELRYMVKRRTRFTVTTTRAGKFEVCLANFFAVTAPH